MRSMTGYGKCQMQSGSWEVTVELRAVNHRYLDVAMRLPRNLLFREDGVRKGLQALVRGHVDVYITVKSEGGDETQVSLNTQILEGYLAAMRQMVEEYGVRDDISVSTLARMNDVFLVEKPQVDEDALLADLMVVVS